ncbi:MAG: FAD-dependent oxidoreductase [Actinomycetota bacterium]
MNSYWYPDWLVPLVGWSALAIFVAVVVGHAVRPKYRRLYGRQALLKSLQHALVPAVWVQIYLWLALIVLWTPVWWIAVFVSNRTEFGTATGWFLGAVVAFYGSWLIRGLTGRNVNQAFVHQADTDDAPPTTAKRVAVIGAGMAGLVAAKELREEGHDVVVFERTAGPGGVWAASKARGGVAWGSTMTSTGALNTTFSDSLTEVFHADNERWPHHFDREQFLGLLEGYEARHGVFDGSLRCEVEVDAMRPLPGDRWRLVVRDTTTASVTEEDFDAVTICTGLNKESFVPDVAGQDRFVGPQLHVEDYRPDEAGMYAGKRVLVMGLGETSSDVVKDLVDHGAEHVYVSQRGGTWVIPREVINLPPDHCETRLVHDGPMIHRWAMLVFGAAPAGLFPLIRPSRLRPPSLAQMLRILVLNHPRKWLLWRLGSLNWTKSDNIYLALDTGRASVRRDVEHLDERRVVFTDGTDAEIDAVIYATGYRPGASLLPPITGSDTETAPRNGLDSAPVPRSARDLYKLTIPPHHPNVAMVGFARGQIGAITLSTELQARWWALVVSGKRSLPTAEVMAASSAQMRRRGRNFHQPTRTTPCFAYSVARQEIGCEPDLFRLFLTDRALWLAVFLGPVCAANFRLRGPRAKPDEARAQLTMPQAVQSDDYVDSVDLFMNTLPLATLVLPLYGVYSRLIPGFNAQNATRSYI